MVNLLYSGCAYIRSLEVLVESARRVYGWNKEADRRQ